MAWYYLLTFISWPTLNMGKLIHSWITGDDIGFIFLYRWFFTVYGPYDLILSDFFSRVTSSIIVFVISAGVGALALWFHLL